MKTPIALLATISFLICGCVPITGMAMQKIQPGMTREQVIKITGNPNGFRSAGDTETLSYTDRPIDWNTPNRADFQVVLKNGRVISCGASEVRKNNVGVIGIVPM